MTLIFRLRVVEDRFRLVTFSHLPLEQLKCYCSDLYWIHQLRLHHLAKGKLIFGFWFLDRLLASYLNFSPVKSYLWVLFFYSSATFNERLFLVSFFSERRIPVCSSQNNGNSLVLNKSEIWRKGESNTSNKPKFRLKSKLT